MYSIYYTFWERNIYNLLWVRKWIIFAADSSTSKLKYFDQNMVKKKEAKYNFYITLSSFNSKVSISDSWSSNVELKIFMKKTKKKKKEENINKNENNYEWKYYILFLGMNEIDMIDGELESSFWCQNVCISKAKTDKSLGFENSAFLNIKCRQS